ncbi:MAG: transporter substrate-binding domain-containing protein [gamma proteobacterium symbiont of Taylorina sp.]|nr:transporter substrate-binding domain-containing protein [gamma proteobacterium symbiont of Taylorina sp.]
MNSLKKLLLPLPIALFFVLQILFAQVIPVVSTTDNTLSSEYTPNKPLIIAYRMDSAPIQFTNKDGEADGMLIDFWRLWSKKSNIPVKFSAGSNKETQDMLKKGRADIIAGLFSNKRRAEFLVFSKAILKSPYSLFLSADIENIHSIEQLGDYPIGVTRSSYHEDFLKTNHPELKRHPFDGYTNLFAAAQTGELKTFIAQPLYLKRYLSIHGKTNHYKKLEPPLYIRGYQAGVAKGNNELVNKINQYFSKITQFERETISNKWVGFNWVEPKDNSFQLSPEEQNWISQNTIVRVAPDPHFQPIESIKNGQIYGLTADYLKKISQVTGLIFETVLSEDFAEASQKVIHGEADMLSLNIPDEENLKNYLFSELFLDMPSVLFVRNDSKIQTLDDLKQHNIAVAEDYPEIHYLKKHYPGVSQSLVSKLEAGLIMVSEGKVDGIVIHLPTAVHLIEQQQIKNLRLIGDIGMDAESGFAVRKDWPILQSILNKGLLSIDMQERQLMQNHWFKIPQGIALNAHANELYLSPKELEWLTKHQHIKLAFDGFWPPYSYLNDKGEFEGLAIDYVRAIEKKLNIKFDIYPDGNWDKLFSAAQNKQVDMVATMVKNIEREKWFNFSQAYISSQNTIVVHNDNHDIKQESDLNGKKIALVKGYFYTELINQNYPDAIHIYVDDISAALLAVSTGQADATITSPGIADYLSRSASLTNLKFASRFGNELVREHFGIRKDWPELISIMDKALDAISTHEKLLIDRTWLAAIKMEVNAKEQQSSVLKLTDEELEWLQLHEHLTIGVMDSWPPISKVNEITGEAEGIDIDIIHELNQQLGKRFKVIPAQWATIYEEAKEKRLDAIMGITPKEFRKKFFNFTRPYLSVPHVIVSQMNNTSFFLTEQELSGKTIALEKSFVNVDYFKSNYPEVIIKTYDNTLDALEAVSRGDADAYAGSRIVVLYLIEKHLLSNLRIQGKLSKKATANAIGIRKDYPVLRDILQKVLDNIGKTGLREIKNHWLYSPQSDKEKINLTNQEKNWLIQHPVIPIGIDGNWPPIDFIDKNNNFQGITADYLALIGQKIGVQFEPKKSESFKIMLNKVVDGELKVGASISFKEERTEKLYFTQPFFHVQKVIMTPKNNQNIHNINDLRGKTIAIEDGFLTMRQLQENYPAIQLMPVKSTLTALQKVSWGEADAYVGNEAVATWLSQKNQLSNLKIVSDAGLGSGPQNFAISKTAPDWEPLIAIIDKALASMTQQQRQEIENRWLGTIQEPVDNIPVLELSNAEKAWLEKHPEVSLAIDSAWEPLEYLDEKDRYMGLSSDYMAYLEKQLGIKFKKPEKMTWSKVLQGLQEKTLDLAPLVTKTKKRSEYLQFTEPYLDFQNVIFSRKGETLLAGMAGLMNKKVGIVKGYAVSELISGDYPDIKQQFFDNTEEGLQALSLGEIDFFIDVVAVGGYRIAEHGLSNLQIVAPTPYAYQFSIGVRNDWPELVSILNKALSRIPQEKKNKFLQNWLVVNYAQKTDYTLFFWVLGIALLIVILLSLRAREMAQVNDKLKEAQQAIERTSQFKSQFLANMSHEIRTPMNAIVGLAHLLSRTDINAQQADYIDNLQKSAQSLLGLINDILDFSKIEAGHLKIENIEFNLDELFNDLAKLNIIRNSAKNIEFLYDMGSDVPEILFGDPFRINQILTNLVSNAIKFTAQGHIIIKVSVLDNRVLENHAVEESKQTIWLMFEVNDSGIGIAANQLNKLFEPFVQEDGSTTRKFGGTGLGLSICKQLTELMGGKIWAQSIQQEGSCFYFKLPFKLTNTVQTKAILESPGIDLRGLKVLLVDDNLLSLEILSQTLQSMSFIVTNASSGNEALQLLSQKDQFFDLVLLDWRMPEMDGEQTSLLIREQISKDKLPIVIMMTAYGREAAEQKINHMALDGFLVKPIMPSQLFNAFIQARQNISQSTGTFDKPKKEPDQFVINPLKGDILLAEDNKINQQVAREILEQMGLNVTICETGVEILQKLEKQHTDLILMDIQMPEMDGYEATRQLRKKFEFIDLPVIAMTANAMLEDIEKSHQAGMDEHISKPVDPLKLYHILSRYLDENNEEQKIDAASTVAPTIKNWPDEVPGLNIKKGIRQVGGNEALYQNLLKDFLKHHGNLEETLQQSIQNGDHKKTVRIIHTIKGVSGNIGADRMQSITSQIDLVLKKGDTISPNLLNSLNEACRELYGCLQQLINGMGQIERNKQKNKPLALSKDDLEKLKSAIENGDSQAHELLQQLSTSLSSLVGHQKVTEITESVQDYEYELALEHLNQALKESSYE